MNQPSATRGSKVIEDIKRYDGKDPLKLEVFLIHYELKVALTEAPLEPPLPSMPMITLDLPIVPPCKPHKFEVKVLERKERKD